MARVCYALILTLLMTSLAVPGFGSAQSICEDSWDDISFFGVAGVDTDRDGRGKAVCFGNLGVNVDDSQASPPGGFAVAVKTSFCSSQSCQALHREAFGAGVTTTSGICLLGGICPGIFTYGVMSNCVRGTCWKIMYTLP